MDINYLESVVIIKDTRVKLEKIIIKAIDKDFENERAYIALENLFLEFEKVMHTIEYYSNPSKEGYLIENSDGVFEIEYIDGGNNYPLNCGNDIEIFINVDGWKSGRVESTHRNNIGYYFYNEKSENHALYSGMKARLRVNDLVV